MNDYSQLTQNQAQLQFHKIVKEGTVAELRALLKARKDIDIEGVSVAVVPPKCALLVAANRRGGYEFVETLLLNGANILATDQNGHTAAHFACSNAEADSLRLLVAYGLDAAQRGLDDKSPYDWMDFYKEEKSLGALKVLYNAGCDPNELIGMEEESALFTLNHRRMYPLLQLALSAGADPLVQNEKGDTPTQIAAAEGHDTVVQLLQEYAHMPRMQPEKNYSVEELFRARNNGQRLVDNPYNWRVMDESFAMLREQKALPDLQMLLSKDDGGKSAAEVAFEAHRGDLVFECLKAHEQVLDVDVLYDSPGKPSSLLRSLCETGQASVLFGDEWRHCYPASVLRRVATLMPEEQKSAIGTFAIISEMEVSEMQRSGIGGR